VGWWADGLGSYGLTGVCSLGVGWAGCGVLTRLLCVGDGAGRVAEHDHCGVSDVAGLVLRDGLAVYGGAAALWKRWAGQCWYGDGKQCLRITNPTHGSKVDDERASVCVVYQRCANAKAKSRMWPGPSFTYCVKDETGRLMGKLQHTAFAELV
jgi:hypothetical protein